jgi:hypothetical protein
MNAVRMNGGASIRNSRPLTTGQACLDKLPVDPPAPAAALDKVTLTPTKPTARLCPPTAEVLASSVAAVVSGPAGLCCATLLKELDPQDVECWDQAERYYERVRACDQDVRRIAHHTPYNQRQVQTIKNHLFYNTHALDDGQARFDADPLIANAWARLDRGEHRAKDLQLLEHELFEARFESLFRTNYRTAHEAADRSGRTSGLY